MCCATLIYTGQLYLLIYSTQLLIYSTQLHLLHDLITTKVLLLILISVDLASVRSREKTSVVSGSSVTLPCRAPGGRPVRWLHTESDIASQFVVFNGSSIEPNYIGKVAVHVDRQTGDFNLSIDNAQMNDSGWYFCIEVNSQLVQHLYLLTVGGLYIVLRSILGNSIVIMDTSVFHFCSFPQIKLLLYSSSIFWVEKHVNIL